VLTRLLRTNLRPYKRDLIVLVCLQCVQVAAALLLPALNAEIIDQGVLTGDTAFIRSRGALMLLFSIVQVVFAVAAMRVGARVAMGFGRDIRAALFHQVTDFSAR
jgi:ATP-binding cassette subfamily B protein